MGRGRERHGQRWIEMERDGENERDGERWGRDDEREGDGERE